MSFEPAMIITGKKKGLYASANNISAWDRYQKTKIKNKFKQDLSSWIPEFKEGPFDEGRIIFKIRRNNKRKLDPDALAVSSFKWFADILVEKGIFTDDDRIIREFHPATVDKNINKTIIDVEIIGKIKVKNGGW